MHFTEDEFNTMVDELLYKKPSSYDMLCRIAEKTLWTSVVRWCKYDDYLRGRGYEHDIMQNIYLQLIMKTVSHFLLHDGIEGPYNNNPEGFERWMVKVAKNQKRNFSNKIRGIDFKTEDIDDPINIDIPADDEDDTEEHIETLKQAFSIVMSSDVGIYKILTWMAQSVFVLYYDTTRIKSNELMLKAFEEMTLQGMYNMILAAAKNIPWIVVTEEQNKKITAALRKKCDGDVLYGEMRYRDFFMKQNGVISGKKSISDWTNRMDTMIKGKFDKKNNNSKKESSKRSKKESPEAQKNKKVKRRSEDEPSDC